MWLFDEFLQNDIKKSVYHTKTNKKVKEEKKEADRFLTKKEIQLKHKKEYDKAFWDRRIKDWQEFNKAMQKERDEILKWQPIPLSTPNEIDNWFLNEYVKDIGWIRYVWNFNLGQTAIWRPNLKKYFDISCPIKLIYSLWLERRYNQWMEIQVEIAKFLKGREREIMVNFSRNDYKLRNDSWSRWLYYWARTGSRSRAILDEWKELHGTRGATMMFEAVRYIYKYGYWSPLQWLHWIGPSYLIGDVVYDGFGHCDYISLNWNREYNKHRPLLHSMALAIRDQKLKKEKLEKIPIFRLNNPIIIRVASNKIQTEEERWTNNGERDYYRTSINPTRPFPSRGEIENKFWLDATFNEKYWYNAQYPVQPGPRASHNLYERDE